MATPFFVAKYTNNLFITWDTTRETDSNLRKEVNRENAFLENPTLRIAMNKSPSVFDVHVHKMFHEHGLGFETNFAYYRSNFTQSL